MNSRAMQEQETSVDQMELGLETQGNYLVYDEQMDVAGATVHVLVWFGHDRLPVVLIIPHPSCRVAASVFANAAYQRYVRKAYPDSEPRVFFVEIMCDEKGVRHPTFLRLLRKGHGDNTTFYPNPTGDSIRVISWSQLCSLVSMPWDTF